MTAERAAMVDQLRAYKVKDQRILQAMGKVWRHVYIPEQYRARSVWRSSLLDRI